MRTVIRRLVPRMESGLRSVIERIPDFIFLAICLLLTVSTLYGQRVSVSCYSSINISINNGTPTRLNLSALTPMTDLSDIEVIIDDRAGLEFDCSDVGKQIMVTLRDLRDTTANHRCMVAVNVEDKTPLQIECPDTAIQCLDLALDDQSGLLKVVSSCDDLSGTAVTYIDGMPTAFPMDSDTLESFTRYWSVTEVDGNVLSCESTIYLTRFDLSQINFPSDLEIVCGQDHTDTTVTGGINFDPLDLLDNCGVGVTASLDGPIGGACLPLSKYRRIWAATDWSSGEIRMDTQYIIVRDTLPTIVTAPNNFTQISDGCQSGIILASPAISTNCTEVLPQDIEVYVAGQIYDIGDTAYVTPPGDFEVIYRGRYLCSAVVQPDTNVVSIASTTLPVLECDSVKDLTISLVDGQSIWIKLDSVFKSIPVTACNMPSTIVGRKIIERCGRDSQDYTASLELCPAELLSGEIPGIIQIEIRAKDNNGVLSSSCIVNIDVQEKVPPVITTLADSISISLDSDDRMFTLDTNIILASLTDNSGCISSLTMTGSGLGLTTGSGLPFLSNGNFFTFDCTHAGMYDVAIFAADCDNNLDTAFTKLTIDPEGICTMTRSITGRVMIADMMPLANVQVAHHLGGVSQETLSDSEGFFSFPMGIAEGQDIISVSHDGVWASGLSVMDLKIIKDYILGQRALEPWQLSAADMDYSGFVSATDIVMIKKLILGISAEEAVAGRKPWLFTQKGGDVESFSDLYEYVIDQEGVEQQYITAAKKGDVNGDIVGYALARSSKDVYVQLSSISQDVSKFTLSYGEFPDLSALQVSLVVNGGQIIGAEDSNDGLWQDQNNINLLLFENDRNGKVEIYVKHDPGAIPNIEITNSIDGLWYDDHHRPHSIQLKVQNLHEHINDAFELVAQPNPTHDRASLRLGDQMSTEEEETSDIFVNLYNIQGQLIFNAQWDRTKVSKVFPLELPALPSVGLYVAQVRINQISNEIYIIKK